MTAQLDHGPALEPVSVPSAAEVVVAQLRRAIELGRFLPGDRLPAERELAVQLGVSRVTLRSALGELEGAGMLERARHGSGGGALLIAARAAAVSDTGHRALREEIEAIFEFRVACESAAAELAAGRRTAADLERLQRAIDELRRDLTPGRFRAADSAFHLAIADASGNHWLRAAVEDARAAMFRPLDAIRFELVVPSTVEHHRRIRAAIAARHAAEARARTIAHLREAHQEILVALAIADHS